jgi:hypothetical protein
MTICSSGKQEGQYDVLPSKRASSQSHVSSPFESDLAYRDQLPEDIDQEGLGFTVVLAVACNTCNIDAMWTTEDLT